MGEKIDGVVVSGSGAPGVTSEQETAFGIERIGLPIGAWTPGATPPTASNVAGSGSPTVQSYLFDATNELLGADFTLPASYKAGTAIKFVANFALDTGETVDDTCDMRIDYVIVQPQETHNRLSSNVNASFVVLAGAIAIDRQYEIEFTIPAVDGNNPTVAGQNNFVAIELRMANVAEVALINFIGGYIEFETAA